MTLKDQYIRAERASYNNRIFHFVVLKGQYIRAERASYNNREYFTLGGCCGTERPKKNEQATITENISLWEGAVVLKGQYIQASYNNREYFTLGG